MSSFKPSNKEICAHFFTLKEGTVNVYICTCGENRKKPTTSYQNLMEHIKSAHPNHLKEIKEKQDSSKGSIVSFVNPNASGVFGW